MDKSWSWQYRCLLFLFLLCTFQIYKYFFRIVLPEKNYLKNLDRLTLDNRANMKISEQRNLYKKQNKRAKRF